MATNSLLPIQMLDPTRMGQRRGTGDIAMPLLAPEPTIGESNPLELRPFTTPTRPDAFAGRALVLSQTVDQQVFVKDQRWPTTRLAPLRFSPEMQVVIQITTANPAFMSVTPERAVGNMTTQTKSVQKFKLLPWSIQAELEHTYSDTAAGEAHRVINIRQLNNAVSDTVNMEAIAALFRTHDPQQLWLERNSHVPYKQFEHWLKLDKFQFAIAQKEPNGLEKLDAKIKMVMADYRGEANGYIIPEALVQYVSLVRPEKTEYRLGGQQAVDRVNGLPNRNYTDSAAMSPFDRIEPTYWVRENAVFVSRFAQIRNAPRLDPFRRTRQIGTYNILEDTTHSNQPYNSTEQAIQIFNMDKDQFDVIDLDYCVDHCALFTQEVDYANNTKLKGIAELKYADASTTNTRMGLKEDPFSYLDAANNVKTARYLGDINPRYFGRDYFQRLKTFFANGNIAPSSRNLFVAGGAAVAQGPDRIGANIMPAQSTNIDKITLDAIAGLVENNAAVQTELQAVADGQGSVMERAGQLYEMVADNLSDTAFNNRATFKKWYDRHMGQYVERAAQGVGQSAFSVPSRLEEIPFFKRLLSPQQGQRRGGARGRSGVANIGAFLYEDEEGQRVEPNVGRGFGVKAGLGNELKLNLNAWNEWLESFSITAAGTLALYNKMMTFLGEPFTKETLKSLVQQNIPHPLNYIIARPHCSFDTRTVVKVALDGAAGYTYWHYSRLEVGHDVYQMLESVNLRAYFRAFFHNPQHVFIATDVAVAAYNGGMGIVPYVDRRQYNSHAVRPRHNCSVFVLAIPVAERSTGRNAIPNPMSITGRFPNRYEDRVPRQRYGHYTTYHRYNTYWGFDKGLDDNLVDMPRFHAKTGHLNMIMYRGRQNKYNAQTGRWELEHKNTGHLGYTYEGCRAVWDGELTELAPWGSRE